MPVGQAMGSDAGEDIVNTVIATGQPPQGGAALSDSASATVTFTQEPSAGDRQVVDVAGSGA